MSNAPDPVEVASTVHRSIVFYARGIRQTPQGELPDPEMIALVRLDQLGSATSSALARAERVTPQAMGATVGALVRRGLAEGRSDPDDGRLTILSLTEAGRQVVRRKETARIRQLAGVLSEKFTAAELEVLLAAAALIERLGAGLR
jgi:DNA-binding MarR family transcriptional regulator